MEELVSKKQIITIIGSGYVGMSLSVLLSKGNNHVKILEIDKDKVKKFLEKNKHFVVDATLPLGMDRKWRTKEGGFRLRPDFWSDFGGMDGFYLIRLNRLGSEFSG